MKVFINECPTEVSQGASFFEIMAAYQAYPVKLLNGFAQEENVPLKEGDRLFFLEGEGLPEKAVYEALWSARYGKANFQKLQAAKVCICGVGGLGSHIALSLARLGIGELLLIDKDRVDMTNLGRQAYEVSDLGKPKAEAMKNIIERITPLVKVTAIMDTIDNKTIDTYVRAYPYIIEAFDSPSNKAFLTEHILSHYPKKILIGASGMSGYDHPNTITTKKLFKSYYLSGDGESEAGLGLLAPRVMLCAAHQANMLMHLILDSKGETND